jgi:hypothetical protein
LSKIKKVFFNILNLIELVLGLRRTLVRVKSQSYSTGTIPPSVRAAVSNTREGPMQPANNRENEDMKRNIAPIDIYFIKTLGINSKTFSSFLMRPAVPCFPSHSVLEILCV